MAYAVGPQRGQRVASEATTDCRQRQRTVAILATPRFYFAKTLLLEKSEAAHGHQGMVVENHARTALRRVEAEFLLELLVGWLARPARLDGSGERLQFGVHRDGRGSTSPPRMSGARPRASLREGAPDRR